MVKNLIVSYPVGQEKRNYLKLSELACLLKGYGLEVKNLVDLGLSPIRNGKKVIFKTVEVAGCLEHFDLNSDFVTPKPKYRRRNKRNIL